MLIHLPSMLRHTLTTYLHSYLMNEIFTPIVPRLYISVIPAEPPTPPLPIHSTVSKIGQSLCQRQRSKTPNISKEVNQL